MKIIRVIDFETTGFPPRAGVCEVGWTDVIFDAGTVTIGETFSLLCNPGLPIGPDAERIHGISDAMVANEPASALRFRSLMEGADAFCAHNAEFEHAFFTGGEKPWVCTYKVALDRFPGLKSYKNGNLPSELGLDLDPGRCEPLHRAGPDTYVTAMILAHFLRAGIAPPKWSRSRERRGASRACHSGSTKALRLPICPSNTCVGQFRTSARRTCALPSQKPLLKRRTANEYRSCRTRAAFHHDRDCGS